MNGNIADSSGMGSIREAGYRLTGTDIKGLIEKTRTLDIDMDDMDDRIEALERQVDGILRITQALAEKIADICRT